MTHPIIKTDNYILITSDEEIKIGDIVLETYLPDGTKGLEQIDTLNDIHPLLQKKVIAHLPLNNSPILEGVPLLPPLPDEEDIGILGEEHITKHHLGHSYRTSIFSYKEGYKKAKEKYKFTEEDMRKAIAMGYDWCHQKYIPDHRMIENFIQSLSQPKLPTHFQPQYERWDHKSLIINGVMQGEWIFE